MKEIPITGKHLVALIDDEDLERVSRHNWSAVRYPKRNTWYVFKTENRRKVLLHRFILGLTAQDPEVDHRNCNGLDNRKENLRLATTSQNAMNRPPKEGRKFKGIWFAPRSNKWRAKIQLPGKQQIYLGTFQYAEEAAKAYDEAAKKFFGEFAYLNFPVETHV